MTGTVRSHLAEDGCLELVLDRPEAGNALSAAMTDALTDALRGIGPDVRAVILTGAGDDFCAGRNSPMPPKDARITAADIRARVSGPVLDFYETVRHVPAPLIVCVRGRAHGVGCALAGLGDIVLADATAEFRVPEMDRDIPPLLVATALADRLPRSALAGLLYGRAGIDAARAVTMGLATEAVDTGALDACLAAWRARLAGNSPTTLRTVKRFLNLSPDVGFSARREYAEAAISAAVSEKFVPKTGAP